MTKIKFKITGLSTLLFECKLIIEEFIHLDGLIDLSSSSLA